MGEDLITTGRASLILLPIQVTIVLVTSFGYPVFENMKNENVMKMMDVSQSYKNMGEKLISTHKSGISET